MPRTNDVQVRRSERLNPEKPVPKNLKKTSSNSEDSSDCDADLNKTIFGSDSRDDGHLQCTAMEAIQKQLEEMRLQLDAALSRAATEKEERIRLEKVLADQQAYNAIVTTSAVIVSGAYHPVVNSTICSVSPTNVVTTTTAGTICTAAELPQSMPSLCSSVSFMQSQPNGSPHPLIYNNETQLAIRSVPYVPTFLPPLTGFPSLSQNPPPPVTTTSCTAAGESSSSTCQVATTRKLHDLPEFTGRPEDWPLFCTAFRDSSALFNYSNVDNLFRLQKSLKGYAREVVEAMLIHPSNVNQAMAALEFRFGRPDILLRSQLLKASKITPISEDNLEMLIPFATKVQNLATFLEASGMTSQLANPTILDELISKLPMSKKLEWIQRSICFQPFPTIRHFEQWLTGAARLVCLVTPVFSQHEPKSGQKSNSRKILYATEQRVSTVKNGQNCRLCKRMPHLLADCSMFNHLDTSSKWNLVKKQRLCFCCLKYGHSVRSCRLKKICGKHDCGKNHHPLLHEDGEAKTSALEVITKMPTVEKNILSCNDGKNNKILFRVLPVRLYGDGVVVRTYALLDEGSSVTIMSMKLAEDLCLKGRKTDLKLQWFGQESFINESYVVDLYISADEDGAERFKMEGAHTVNELRLPIQTLTDADLDPEQSTDILARLQVTGYNEASPQILIGLDNCHLGAPIRIMGTNKAGPIVTETKLGYVVYGKTSTTADYSARVLVLNGEQKDREEEDELTRMVDEYLSIENFGVKKPKEKLISANEKRALQILFDTTTKIDDRYQTGLLWKQNNIELPPSYDLAIKRLCSLENKFRRETEFANKYRSIISSYIDKGYARKLTCSEARVHSLRTWYLPHFAVKNPNKPDKIRLVFDAAAKVDGISLNSMLLKGPDDLKPLMTILFNFRMRRIAVTGDIKEMFHQVVIQPEDQNSQRFVWRESEDQPVEVYVMQSMTFGATCSPCSANFVKNLNAKRFADKYPRAVMAITDHHYVDDYVESFNSIEEAIEVTNAVVSIHRSGGFELRNFISNSEEVLNSIISQGKQERRAQVVNMNVEATVEKVLGMYWDPGEDIFVFKLNFSRVSDEVMKGRRCPTKRELLAVTMSVFDPYGMIANFVVHAKLLLQSVWRYGTEWDQPIPEEIFQKWCQWKSELHNVMQLKIPRCYPSHHAGSRIVLHTFVDASEEAFSAAVYMRVEYMKAVNVVFIWGKTRCAPKRLMSIPRLELSAAVLGVRLCDSVIEFHNLNPDDRVFWSDSKTVLSWLRADPRHHKQFVGFRVAEILDSTKVSQWRWIPTKLNPADEATRGRYPPAFRVDNKWINGATFLKLSEDQWPPQPHDFTTCREEMKPKFLFQTNVSTKLFEFSRFSKYVKLKRSVAWVLRFVKACRRQSIEKGELSALELNEAERVLCSVVQRDVFAQELCQLRCNQQVEKTSPIYKLTPYLDDDGLLRVYGRIDAATTIPFSSRRPIILPKDHEFTSLIVAHFHRRICHQNDDTVANEIRQTFWVPSLRSAIKKERSRCAFCLVRSTCPLPPLMGQLPEDRLTPFLRPFTYTGLDYFGPVNVTVGRRKEKRWIALFTCMTVRAVHLELAADLSTDACILCIRNFVNRRGVPVRIRSDNGTNFIGAKNELLTADIFDCDAIKAELSARGIDWKFNCPSNPHAGGCWERLVRSVKRVLSITLKELAPKPETLVSALIEAENIVNSRPLTHLPVTTEEEEPLTPNHFLMGVTNSTQTPGPINERALCLRKQWRISQQIKDRFWRRWIKEYLPELTMRSKWFAEVPNIKVGDLVLVCDANVPRSLWVRGRIVKVFVGPDNQVRSADVKTSTGIHRRPVVKLAVLRFNCETSVEPSASRGAGC